ncbi:MAG: pentapeptide repeat-containing protein [bacterium]|nr:pentapeptide repeat-containing protein [bacterium]
MSLITNSETRLLLVDGKIDEFNRLAGEEQPDLENVDLRSIDLRGVDLSHANLRGSYMRNADMRGLDLFHADLDGASIHGARISGVRFPRCLPPDEILLAMQYGTRLRVPSSP